MDAISAITVMVMMILRIEWVDKDIDYCVEIIIVIYLELVQLIIENY
jgi:hypothetical protein